MSTTTTTFTTTVTLLTPQAQAQSQSQAKGRDHPIKDINRLRRKAKDMENASELFYCTNMTWTANSFPKFLAKMVTYCKDSLSDRAFTNLVIEMLNKIDRAFYDAETRNAPAANADVLAKYQSTPRPFTGVLVDMYRAHPTQANYEAVRAAVFLYNKGFLQPALTADKLAMWNEDGALLVELNIGIMTATLVRQKDYVRMDAKRRRLLAEQADVETESEGESED